MGFLEDGLLEWVCSFMIPLVTIRFIHDYLMLCFVPTIDALHKVHETLKWPLSQSRDPDKYIAISRYMELLAL